MSGQIYLNLAEDGRILSAAIDTGVGFPCGYAEVDTLPDGDISDYRLVDGEYIYDPIPCQTQTGLSDVEKLKIRLDASEAATLALMGIIMGGM